MSELRCDTCRYWVKWDADPKQGECRISPPAPVTSAVGVWPSTHDSDWCGKHERIELPPTQGPHTQHPGNKKPPLGVLPLRLWQESNPNPDLATIAKRHIDVCNAVIRYHQAGLHVPPQWLREMGIIVETTRDPGQTTGGDGQETQTPHGGG